MNPLIIKSTSDTPSIIFDPSNGIFEISEKSLPENVNKFYGPVIEWIRMYVQEPKPKTIVIIKMGYFNTASSKVLLDILMAFEVIHESANRVLIKWYYKEKDIDMKDAGEEYDDIIDVMFEHIAY